MPLTHPYHVLLVDDDPDHVVLVKIVFAHLDADARVEVTWSAEEAMAHLQARLPSTEKGPQGLPDLILLDVNMPGIGGLGFLEWYRQQPEIGQIPVVMFTSVGDAQVEERCLALGAREFKVKPYDFTELVPVIQRVLDRWPAAQKRRTVGE